MAGTEKSEGGLLVCAPASKCPQCGFVADGVRCPRCFALKVKGCEGGCSSCGAKKGRT